MYPSKSKFINNQHKLALEAYSLKYSENSNCMLYEELQSLLLLWESNNTHIEVQNYFDARYSSYITINQGKDGRSNISAYLYMLTAAIHSLL